MLNANGEDNSSPSQSPEIYSWFDKKFNNTQTKESSVNLYKLALNRRPAKDQEVKLGVISPVEGDYTFSLKVIQELSLKAAFLCDNKASGEGKYLDLLDKNASSRSYFLSKGTTEDRFVLILYTTTSALPIDKVAVDESDIFAYANNNILVVKNIQKGDQVRILDLSGRTIVSEIASTNEFTTPLVQKGVYIVNIKGEKNAVLKVMNK
jgi:hypothetical protein